MERNIARRGREKKASLPQIKLILALLRATPDLNRKNSAVKRTKTVSLLPPHSHDPFQDVEPSVVSQMGSVWFGANRPKARSLGGWGL